MRAMKLSRRIGAALALAGAIGVAGGGQAKAAELFFDFNRNAAGGGANASLFLFGDAGQQATVSNLAGFSEVVTLGANGFFNLSISNVYQQSGTGVRDSGFRVQSGNPIAGYFVNRASQTTDMTYLLDSSALGTSYMIASQGGGFGEGSQVAIHATQDNTSVTYTPINTGVPVNVTLNAGQTYKVAGGTVNLTGSNVVSDKPVAVFAGHECAQVPAGVIFCDTLLEQMIPTDRLSTSYALAASQAAALANGTSDLVRVIASEDATQVSVNGVVVATLNKGQVHEFALGNGTGAKVDASRPVMVAQYLKGGEGANTDPAMSLVPGSDTWLNSYRLATPSGSQDFPIDYASLVIETDDLASLLLDGGTVDTSGCTPIAGTPYSRCNVTLPNGLFTLSATDPFLVMLGGGGAFDSYLTYGGATFAPGISPPPPPTGTPEPATLALFGTGILGLAALRRRRA